MSSINCQGTLQAILAALSNILGLIMAEVSKGNIAPALAGDAASIMQDLLTGPVTRAGASSFPSLFAANLPQVVASAKRRQASRVASGASPPNSSPTDPLGLGPAGGWPDVGPAGPGGVGSAGPGSGQAQWPTTKFGYGGGGLSTDPALRPSFGPNGTGSFFDSNRPAAGSFPGAPRGGLASSGDPSTVAGAPAGPVTGLGVTTGELGAYFNSAIAPSDDDTFVIAEWIGPGQNPLLFVKQLASARQLYYGVVRPCARYYKGIIYGDPDFAVRLGQILYGIVSERVVRQVLRGGPTSRHLLGEAVNFAINGVEDHRVVSDIASGEIEVTVGTYGAVNGIHASLPFVINGLTIDHLRLYSNTGVLDFVGYSFNQGTQAP